MIVFEYLISGIIVTIVPLIFIKIIENPSRKKSTIKRTLILVMLIFFNMIIYKYTSGLVKTAISLLIYIVDIKYFYNIKIKKNIILSVLYIITLVISELIILWVLDLVNVPKSYIYNEFAGSLLSNIVIYTFTLLLALTVKNILTKFVNMEFRANIKTTIFSILSLLSILILFYNVITNFKVGAEIVFYIIAIFIFVSVLIIVIYEENKNLKLRFEYRKIFTFIKKYEKEIEKERIIKHKNKKQLIIIKDKILDKEDKDKIINYINDIIKEKNTFSQQEYVKFQYLPSNGIKSLFYFKVSNAKLKQINLSINISPSIREFNLEKLSTKQFKQLSLLIGVYLDNAIEASAKSEKKMLGIEIYKVENSIEIIITNTYSETIDKSKIGKEHYTTKGKGHGYGLSLARRILKHNKKISGLTEIRPDIYIQYIIIKK